MDEPTTPESKAEPLTTHHLGLLVEMFENHKKVILEGMSAMEERLERKWDERFAKIEMRLDVLELAVRRNSEDIRKNSEDIRKNSEDIKRMTHEIAELRVRLEGVERTINDMSLDNRTRDGALDDLDQRVRTVEDKLGIG